MAFPVSQRFSNAQAADVNKPVSKVQLVLGNYCNAAAYGTKIVGGASTSPEQLNYPATGVIDGDRTEINVGAASTADNDVGNSSYRSQGVPSTVFQGVTINFGVLRTINRIKLYHLFGHGMKEISFGWSTDGVVFHTFACTPEIVGAGITNFTTTFELDVIDFPDITCQYLEIEVFDTQIPGDFMNVVEIEAYRKIDITSRVKSVQISRQRDYKLANNMAAGIKIDCDNSDRFFSISHVPTAAEAAAGFVNQELAPGVGLLVSLGFDYDAAAPELVSAFVGQIDSLVIKPKTRDASIQGRDGMKVLINRTDGSKIKTGQDIGLNIQYVLNRANISNYEMALDETGINIDYFFSDQQAQLDTIRDLVQAAVDAIFYFDENGIATFKFFTQLTIQQKVFTTQADWQSGLQINTDTTTIPGDLLIALIEDFDNLSSSLHWSQGTSDFTSWTYTSGRLQAQTTGGRPAYGSYRLRESTGARPYYQFDYEFVTQQLPSHTILGQCGFAFATNGDPVNGPTGYLVRMVPTTVGGTATMTLEQIANGVTTGVLATATYTEDLSNHTIKITRDHLGAMVVFRDSVQILTATDNTYSQQWSGFYVNVASGTIVVASFNNFFYGNPLTSGQWDSPVIDTGIFTKAYGLLDFTALYDGGTIEFATQSSDDGITFDSLTLIDGSGHITSAVRRYLRIVVIMQQSGLSQVDLNDMTVNWSSGGSGSLKYPLAPASFTFRFDSSLLDVEQSLADDLGGDTSIINDVIVQAQPLVLTGTNTDTVWQGTTAVPPVPISPTNSISVLAGQQIIISPYIAGGMDISQMAGANPPALAVTFAGGATGLWSFTRIHPTLPVVVLNISHAGTITDLRIIGQIFSNSTYFQAQQSIDTTSVALYGDRQITISNNWITSASVASVIAQTLVKNSKDPTLYIPKASVRPTWAIQLGDRVTVNDINLDLNGDYIVASEQQDFSAQIDSANMETQLTLIAVPAGQ